MNIMDLKDFCNTVSTSKLAVTKTLSELEMKSIIFQVTDFLDVYGTVPIALRYYCILNDVTEIPKCVCGNITRFNKNHPKLGFAKFCSEPCSQKYKHKDKLHNTKLPDRDWLYHQRITLQKSKEQIAKELGCSTIPVTKWLEKHNIEQRQTGIKNTKIDMPPKEELEYYHYTKQMNILEISELYDASNVTVKKWFVKYGIEIVPHYVKWIEDNFKKYNLDLEKLSDFDYLETICQNSTYYKLSENYFNKMPTMSIFRHLKRIGFDPGFKNNNSSIGELEIGDYVSFLGFDIIRCDRNCLQGFELDIYIPNQNLAIEFNGLYYHHSDENKHSDKMLAAQNKNILLLNFYEDEWYNSQDKVKSIINYHLKISNNLKIEHITTIDENTAKSFYEENYIKSYFPSVHYAAFSNNKIIALLSVTENGVVNYVTKLNCNPIDGLQIMINHIKQHYSKLYAILDLRFNNVDYQSCGKFISYIKSKFEWTNPSKLIRLPQSSQVDETYLKIWNCGYNLYEIQ
jgi:hypothetical protein